MNTNYKKYLMDRAETAVNQISDLTGVRGVQDNLLHPRRPGVTTLAIPGYVQVQTYTCGFVTAANVLHLHAPDADLAFLYSELDHHSGTNEVKVTNALREYGISIRTRVTLDFRSLCTAVKAGSPIICSVETSRCGHWIVVYGCDTRAKTLFLCGNGSIPWFTKKEVPYKEFQSKWEPAGFGLVCSKGRLRKPQLRKAPPKVKIIKKK